MKIFPFNCALQKLEGEADRQAQMKQRANSERERRESEEEKCTKKESSMVWKLSGDAEAELKEIFCSLDKNQDASLSSEDRNKGAKLLNQFLFKQCVTLDGMIGISKDKNLTFAELKAAVEKEQELTLKEQSLSGINVARIVASSIPGGSPENPLAALASMKADKIKMLCCGEIADRLNKALQEHAQKLQSSSSRAAPDDLGNSKFAMLQTARFSRIEEYYQGLEGALGLPSNNLLQAMEHEHCKRPDSGVKFRPGNYAGLETSPAE
jgi:hypothetical protein